MSKIQLPVAKPKRRPWNRGRLVGQKRPLLPKQVWAIRARLELSGNLRDLTLFNLAIDSKLRGCDLVRLKVADLIVGDCVRERVSVIQSKTQRTVQFEVTENTRASISAWVARPEMIGCASLFPSRFHDRPHISTRQYARLVRDWVTAIGLEPSGYGTRSRRRRSTARQAIFARSSSCLATRRWTVPSATWGSNLRMLSASPSRSTSDNLSERRMPFAIRDRTRCGMPAKAGSEPRVTASILGAFAVAAWASPSRPAYSRHSCHAHRMAGLPRRRPPVHRA